LTWPTFLTSPGDVSPSMLVSLRRSTSVPLMTTPTSAPSFSLCVARNLSPFRLNWHFRQQFTEGWAKFQQHLTDIDEEAGEIMNEYQLQQLKARIVTKDDKQKESLGLLEEATCIVYQDKLKHVKDSKELEAILLDNCLILAKESSKHDLKLFQQIFPLDSLSIVDLADVENGAIKNIEALSTEALSFRITYKGDHDINIVVAASSAYTKDSWIRYLSQ